MTARIHILGASGAGVTTLGRALALALDVPVFDSDDYYWLPTEPPYRCKRPIPDRIALLRPQLLRHPHWILSGSLIKWSGDFEPLFTHIIFLTLDNDVRLQRLVDRESDRFGARVQPGGDMYAQSRDFLAYAARYESDRLDMRTRAAHERWLHRLHCPILRLDAIEPVDALVRQALPWLDAHPHRSHHSHQPYRSHVHSAPASHE